MSNENQFSIIKEIVDEAVLGVKEGWLALVISCYIDDKQSDFFNTYLIKEEGSLVEKSLPFSDSVVPLFRRLRSLLTNPNGEEFSGCRLFLDSNGKFDASYSYDALDWDAISLDWDRSNFNQSFFLIR